MIIIISLRLKENFIGIDQPIKKITYKNFNRYSPVINYKGRFKINNNT